MSAAQEGSVPPHQDRLRDTFSLEEPSFKDGGLCKEYCTMGSQIGRTNTRGGNQIFVPRNTHTPLPVSSSPGQMHCTKRCPGTPPDQCFVFTVPNSMFVVVSQLCESEKIFALTMCVGENMRKMQGKKIRCPVWKRKPPPYHF